MANTGITPRLITDVFNGQSDVVLFNAPTGGYTASTTFAQVTAAGMSLGQIVENSTSWDGDEASIDTVKDEQGDIIVSNVTGGTYAFSFAVADLSKEMVTTIMQAAEVATPGTSTSIGEVTELMKFVELPVITRPIGIFNDEANKFIFVPKAKIVGSISLDGKLWRLNVKVTAEYINTETLGTFMLGKGKPLAAGAGA